MFCTPTELRTQQELAACPPPAGLALGSPPFYMRDNLNLLQVFIFSTYSSYWCKLKILILLISAIFETFSFLIFLALLSVLDDALCTPAAGLSPPFPHPCANLGISLNDQDKSAFHLLLEMWDISSTYFFFCFAESKDI